MIDRKWCQNDPDSKVHGANMGPTEGRQVPGGPHDGPINIATRAVPNGILLDWIVNEFDSGNL